MKHSSCDAIIDREIARWPGVAVRRVQRSKHCAFVFTFNGAERFVIYPSTGSDSMRGVYNRLRDIRAAMRALGAQRLDEQRSGAARAKPHRRQTAQAPRLTDHAPTRLALDPFAVLQNWRGISG